MSLEFQEKLEEIVADKVDGECVFSEGSSAVVGRNWDFHFTIHNATREELEDLYEEIGTNLISPSIYEEDDAI